MKAKFGQTEIDLRHAGGVFCAKVGGIDVALRVAGVDAPHARIAIENIEETVTFVIDGDTVHLARAGQSLSLENTTHAPPMRRASAASDGRLIAPMNGRVVAVNAKAGDTAEAGKALVVLEAMKMEHVLSVPARARVKAVHVVPGAQVSPGQLLVEVEPAS